MPAYNTYPIGTTLGRRFVLFSPPTATIVLDAPATTYPPFLLLTRRKIPHQVATMVSLSTSRSPPNRTSRNHQPRLLDAPLTTTPLKSFSLSSLPPLLATPHAIVIASQPIRDTLRNKRKKRRVFAWFRKRKKKRTKKKRRSWSKT